MLRFLLAPSRPNSITTLDSSDLEYVDNYLGVRLDYSPSRLTLSNSNPKLKSRIRFLFHNNASFTHATKHTLIKLNILPVLDFSDIIYKIASNTTQQIGCSLSQCHRFCHKSPIHTTHHCNLYALVGWLSFQSLTGTNRKNLWSWSLTAPSNFKYQLSEQLTNQCTQPICKQHTQLPHPHYLPSCTPVSLLAHLSCQCYSC